MRTKLTPEEAWALIAQAASQFGHSSSEVAKACRRTAASNLFAPISLPPFHNSAVDGYALGTLEQDFKLVGTIGAGEFYAGQLAPGEACRIMTGAKIPTGTIAVAMQEDALLAGDRVSISRPTREGAHIRWCGEDLEKGQCVLSKGERVTPAHVGLLSALGVSHVDVARPLRSAIISTGSELVDPGQPLGEGEVYYCTGPMLSALCESAQTEVLSVAKVVDDEVSIVRALDAAKVADVIIMIGGMAGGLYDFGRSAFAKVGVTPVFFEGQWRPGKPLFFGTLGQKLVFGLPGNPVAAYVMFKIFIEPAIRQSGLKWGKAEIVGAKPKLSDKAQFLRARKVGENLELVPGQGSHQLYNLSLSDAIVWVPAGENSGEHYAYLPLAS